MSEAGIRRPLAVAVRLFDALDHHGVRYCHWKSNAHLREGLCGITDLDLLVDRRQAPRAQELFARYGFKRFTPAAGRGYSAVEDHVALDAATGVLVHCHVHYRLVAGERHLKGYRLPWEELALAGRVRDPETGVWMAAPEMEMLLLLVRFALKLRWRDLARGLVGRGGASASWRLEHEWLRARIDRDTCRELCRTLLGDEALDVYGALVDGPVTLRRALRLRRAVHRGMAVLRTRGAVTGRAVRWARELAWLAAGINRRRLRSTSPLRRTVPAGGVTIAFLGCDGSGKSTMSRDVAELLASKLDVLHLYFGSGDGPASLLRAPLRLARAVAERTGLRRRRAAQRAVRGERVPPSGAVESLALLLWAVTLSLEKRRKLRASWKARNLGMIVVTDRYPQTQIDGFMDGPLLGHLLEHRSAAARWLARWERAPYAWAERHPPDLVLRLDVGPETALRRKPDTGPAEVERRVAAIRALHFPPPACLVDVDAERPVAEVRRAVRGLVWNQI
jgi:thymidylate kinase